MAQYVEVRYVGEKDPDKIDFVVSRPATFGGGSYTLRNNDLPLKEGEALAAAYPHLFKLGDRLTEKEARERESAYYEALFKPREVDPNAPPPLSEAALTAEEAPEREPRSSRATRANAAATTEGKEASE